MKIKNANFKWVLFLGLPHVWDIKKDTWVISVNDLRLYFTGDLGYMATSKIFENMDDAMNVATEIINKNF